MSHVTSYATNVKLESALTEGKMVEEDPGWGILDEAVQVTAEEFGFQVGSSIKDYYGRVIPCDWALYGSSFVRGVGVKVDKATGDVAFISDTYGGFERIAGEVKNRVLQNFSTICVASALKALSYSVDVEETSDPVCGKKVFLKGVL